MTRALSRGDYVGVIEAGRCYVYNAAEPVGDDHTRLFLFMDEQTKELCYERTTREQVLHRTHAWTRDEQGIEFALEERNALLDTAPGCWNPQGRAKKLKELKQRIFPPRAGSTG